MRRLFCLGPRLSSLPGGLAPLSLAALLACERGPAPAPALDAAPSVSATAASPPGPPPATGSAVPPAAPRVLERQFCTPELAPPSEAERDERPPPPFERCLAIDREASPFPVFDEKLTRARRATEPHVCCYTRVGNR